MLVILVIRAIDYFNDTYDDDCEIWSMFIWGIMIVANNTGSLVEGYASWVSHEISLTFD